MRIYFLSNLQDPGLNGHQGIAREREDRSALRGNDFRCTERITRPAQHRANIILFFMLMSLQKTEPLKMQYDRDRP
jgi:hypothetical protein